MAEAPPSAAVAETQLSPDETSNPHQTATPSGVFTSVRGQAVEPGNPDELEQQATGEGSTAPSVSDVAAEEEGCRPSSSGQLGDNASQQLPDALSNGNLQQGGVEQQTDDSSTSGHDGLFADGEPVKQWSFNMRKGSESEDETTIVQLTAVVESLQQELFTAEEQRRTAEAAGKKWVAEVTELEAALAAANTQLAALDKELDGLHVKLDTQMKQKVKKDDSIAKKERELEVGAKALELKEQHLVDKELQIDRLRHRLEAEARKCEFTGGGNDSDGGSPVWSTGESSSDDEAAAAKAAAVAGPAASTWLRSVLGRKKPPPPPPKPKPAESGSIYAVDAESD